MPTSLTTSAAPIATTKNLLIVPDRHLEMAPFADHYPPELDDYWLEFRKIHAWELNTHNDKARSYSKYFRVKDLRTQPERIQNWINTSMERGYHVFFARNPLFAKKRGASRCWNVAYIVSFVIDLDGLSPDEGRDRLKKAQRDGMPEPGTITATGHGVHAYIRPERPVSVAVAEDFLDRFTTYWEKHPALAPYLDPRVKDRIRVLRCSGSANFKDFNYSAPGMNLTPGLVCRILHHDPDCAHPLSAIVPGVQDADLYRGMEEQHADLERHHDAVMGWIKSERKAGRRRAIPRSIRTVPDAWRYMVQQEEQGGSEVDDGSVLPSVIPASSASVVIPVGDSRQSSISLAPSFLLGYGGTSQQGDRTLSPRGDTLARWDVFNDEKVEEFLDNPAFLVPGPRHRNHVIARIVARALKRWDHLPVDCRIQIHDRWWKRNQRRFSGQHTKDESRAEFFYCWEKFDQDDTTSRTESDRTFATNDEFIGFVMSSLVQHPHDDRLAPQASLARRLAALLYTGSKLVDFSPDRFFMSKRIMAKALKKDQKSVERARQQVLREGIVEVTKPGDRVSATYYSIPEEMR